MGGSRHRANFSDLVMTVAEAARALGIGRNAGYAAVRRGEIPCLRIGRRLLVPRRALERMLAAQSDSHLAPRTQRQSEQADDAGK